MKNTRQGGLSNPAVPIDAHLHAREEIEERARATSRKLSRSWLWRLAVVAGGLVAAGLARRHRSEVSSQAAG